MKNLNLNPKQKIFIKRIYLPCISAVIMGLLQTCFDAPLLCFVGLVPLCISVINEHSFSVYIMKFSAFAFLYYIINFSFFIKITDLVSVPKIIGTAVSLFVIIIISSFASLILVLVMSVFQKITKGRITDSFLFAFLFVFGEYIMEIIPFVSFPWSRIELSCISLTPFMQVASLFGGRFAGIIIVSINALIAVGIKSYALNKKTVTSFASAVIIYLLVFSFGLMKINSEIKTNALNEGDKINVLIAQGSVMGAEKWGISKNKVFLEYDEILKQVDLNNVDLVVMPETALCENINESPVTDYLKSVSKNTDTVIATGSFYYDRDNDKQYNTLSYISPDADEVFSYFKQRLVPFGEYVPFGKLLSDKNSLEAGNNNFAISTPYGKMASVVCIESIYSSIARKQVKDGAKIILIATNDSWFENTAAREQHFRHSRLRAIENGRYVLRAANCGISSVIMPCGEITGIISNSERGKIISEARLISKRTLYAMTGDLFWYISLVIILIGINKMVKQKYSYKFLNKV